MPSLTLNYSAAYGQRVARALGKAWNLKDANDEPRAATAAEFKTFIKQRVHQLVVDIEGEELRKAALANVAVPDGDMT